MTINKRVASAALALADVTDGATVFISGFGGAGFPNQLIRALRERGTKRLTLVVNSATHRYSLTHELIEAGQVAKVICSAARGAGKELSPFEQLWKAGKIELVCLPQGTFAEAIRAGGAVTCGPICCSNRAPTGSAPYRSSHCPPARVDCIVLTIGGTAPRLPTGRFASWSVDLRIRLCESIGTSRPRPSEA